METSPVAMVTDMEDDVAVSKRAGSDNDMEGSDVNWNDVASGSDDYGGDGDDSDDGDQQDAEEDDGDDGGDEEDDEDRDLIILCSMSLGRWERYEAGLEANMEAEAGKQVLSSTQGLAAKRQIFNPREAFSMLSRELLDFLRARHMDCSVETGGDDLYHWVVDLGSFADSSALARDMREVSRRYFYSTVRLRLRFMRGLHPFFPPSVEVVWPHFAGPLLGAVASHPMLRLENWDPWRPAMDTVGQIKAFLEAHARVDLDDPVNDIRRHPHSTYSPLERGLARLEALSGASPTCLAQPDIAALYAARDAYHKDAARLQALAEAGKKRSRSEPAGAKRNREVVWARGTGYGSGHDRSGEQWDAKATEAAQRARDLEIHSLLADMHCSLVGELGRRTPLPLEADDTERQQKQAGPGSSGGDAGASDAAATTAGTASGDASAAGASGAEAMEGVETATGSGGTASATDCAPEDAALGGTAGGGGGGASGGSATAAAATTNRADATADADAADAPLGSVARAAPAAGTSYDGTGGDAGSGSEPRLGAQRCPAVLRDSCLLPFIVRELQMASFADMGARHKYYLALLVLLRDLCRPETHDMLWMQIRDQWPQPTQHQGQGQGQEQGQASSERGAGPGRCVADIVTTGLRSAARMYLNVLGPATAQAEKAASSSASAASSSFPATRIHDKVAVAAENAAREAEATQRMAQIIVQVAAYMDANAPLQASAVTAGVADAQERRASAQACTATAAATAATTDGERAASGGQASTSAGGAAALPAAGPSLYVATLKPLQVDAVSGLGKWHHYSSNVRGEQQTPRTRAVRLAKEVASLESLLPLSESSSVFVRVDETAVQLWKAIIVGPEDTPYSGGCFVFDLYFPPQYPIAPPQVHLMTTGGGRVRFNPNLYAEGKVCLSLLGTWSGDRGENWNPDVSTAVQVLISVQSLIMVPEPYFNEPSYESQTGDRGKAASHEYNKAVRENCVRYAMLDVLRHPPAALADVVRAHFRLRRDALLAQIKRWADDERATDSAYAGRLMDLRQDFETLIGSLQ